MLTPGAYTTYTCSICANVRNNSNLNVSKGILYILALAQLVPADTCEGTCFGFKLCTQVLAPAKTIPTDTCDMMSAVVLATGT